MDKNEIALQLTLKAIENKAITFEKSAPDKDYRNDVNQFNINQIIECYNSFIENLNINN